MNPFTRPPRWLTDFLGLQEPQLPNALAEEVLPTVDITQGGWYDPTRTFAAAGIAAPAAGAENIVVPGSAFSIAAGAVTYDPTQESIVVLYLSARNPDVAAHTFQLDLVPPPGISPTEFVEYGQLALAAGGQVLQAANIGNTSFHSLFPIWVPPGWILQNVAIAGDLNKLNWLVCGRRVPLGMRPVGIP